MRALPAFAVVVLAMGCARERPRPIASDPTPMVAITEPLKTKPPRPASPIVVEVTVVAGPPPKAEIAITNVGDVDVVLEDRLGIELDQGGAWVDSPDLYDTIAPTCAGLSAGPLLPRPCQRVASDFTLKPPPWLGWSCSSQCIGTCRANVPRQNGRYRFFVTTCADEGAAQTRFVSEPFDWPGALP